MDECGLYILYTRYMDESYRKPAHAEMLTKERLSELATLSLEVATDFSGTLAAVNAKLGTAMQSRAEGAHLTIISPHEGRVFQHITDEQFEDLHEIGRSIRAGDGVEVTGIGYIDGASQSELRPADMSRRTCFVTLDIPALDTFRNSLGLQEKDFHITLGFEGGDINSKIVGRKETGGSILGIIAKKVDPNFSDIPLPELVFGQVSGKKKVVSQE